jgi:hypothetical protein
MTGTAFLTVVLFLVLVLFIVRYGIPFLRRDLPKPHREKLNNFVHEIKEIQMGGDK